MGIYRSAALLTSLTLVLALGGCTSLLGDFTSGGSSVTDGGGHADVGAGTGDGGSSSSGGGSDAAGDSPVDTGMMATDGSDEGEAAPPPPPPPPAGKPGFDLTSGGNSSASINYRMRSALGEAPGGYVIGKSSSYTLKGGVIAGTE